MAMFASKTPRDLNRDPRPYLVHTTAGTEFRSHWTLPGDDAEFLPRPEYDHVQHNEVNPILVDVRANLHKGYNWSRMLFAFTQATEYTGAFVTAEWERIEDEAIIDHARRVLSRLAALESNE